LRSAKNAEAGDCRSHHLHDPAHDQPAQVNHARTALHKVQVIRLSTSLRHSHPLRSFSGVAALLLLVALVVGLFLTRGGDPSLAYNASAPLPNTAGLVDQTPLQTARTLSALAATAAEVEYAQQAIRLSDHEVDQAFAEALRSASEQQPALSGAALQVAHRIATVSQRVQQEQQALQVPEQGSSVDTELAQARLALDQDDLADLQQDLIRVGGDRKAKIQQALDQHEAVQQLNAGRMHNEQVQQLESPDGLRTFQGKVRAWLSLNERTHLLADARKDALQSAAALTTQHDALEVRAEAASALAATPETPQTLKTLLTARADTLGSLHAMAGQRTALAQFDKRIHDEQQLADLYGKWRSLVTAQRRMVLHRMLLTACLVLVLLAAVFLADSFIRRLVDRRPDARRHQTLRTILTLAIQAVSLVLILMVLFGTPTQTPTIIGIVTAGLTVVLKDFIVAFFGWFVLMGKNGVRIGDWVEINGVSGEVTELGIIRTTLLETGKWAESAHPTGRRVTFMNGYAIEGQFFNFSTTGQWLWDELRLTVPSGPRATEKIEAIRLAAEQRTAQDAALAAQDWQRATRVYGAASREFTAAPFVELRPSADNIQLIVRYLTRADERAQVRAELYERSIEVLHAAETGEAEPVSAALKSTELAD
jgi:small-conductance mechanosensitive channel/predicted outer membrane protein